MFVASSLYNYATSKASPVPAADATPASTRVKRRPKAGARSPAVDEIPTSPPPSYADVASGAAELSEAERPKYAAIDAILGEEDLYKILGVRKTAKNEEIRRGFLNRSRTCHPDKFPNYAPSTTAFQKVSFAYETLSKPSSRRMYDISGRTDFAAAMNASGANGTTGGGVGDETLNGVLYSVFCEFMEGDFEMIRVLINAMNEGNPGLDMGSDAVENLEGAFRRLREMMLAGRKYLRVIRFELIRLYEIQHSLRQLSYFDVFGRLRLTLQLARVTLSIPMAIDEAMKEPLQEENGGRPAAYEADRDGDSNESSDESMDEEEESASTNAEATNSKDQLPTGAHTRRRPHGPRRGTTENGSGATAEFGIAPDEPEDADVDHAEAGAESARARRRQRRHRRRANRARNGLEANQDADAAAAAAALQRRGLLGSTTTSLLKGVVGILETGEGWVPGRRTTVGE